MRSWGHSNFTLGLAQTTCEKSGGIEKAPVIQRKTVISNCIYLLHQVYIITRGGGGTLIFSAYVGSDPASTVHPPKNIRNFKHPKKIFEILATPKIIPIL